MYVTVNGARLFFDVEGAGLVADGPSMRQKPTLLLLHGGPGYDHSVYKPDFSPLADIAQLVYLDHRGNGRSDAGTPDQWNLAQWGDDVRAFCEALGIEKPIVLGISFGGMVALAYATRHPDHPARLILGSTEAAGWSHRERRVELFGRFGGPELAALARRRFIEGDTSPEVMEQWRLRAMPLYLRRPADPDAAARAVRRPDVLHWFNRPDGEGRSFDLRPTLPRIACPTLVFGGEDDPMTPIESQEEIAALLPPALVRFERFPGCGHGVVHDNPQGALDLIRAFVAAGP